MPKKAQELSAKAVAKLAREGKDGFHAVGGVDGLLLQIRGEHGRSWVLRVRIQGQRRMIGLGSFGDLSLADARRKAQGLRTQIANGIDPLADKRETAAPVMTFDDAARLYIAAMSDGWRNAKHRAQWSNTLKTYVSPHMGKVPVADVALPHVLACLEPIWRSKTETAKRVRGRIEAVLDWAEARELRKGENPARWRGKLDKLFPAPSKVAPVRHHPALPIDDMHAFMADLRGRDGTAARALEFAILTAARSGEVRGATWSEIDLDAATWTIPGERMKAGNLHRVPLSAPALALLRALPRMAGTDLLFPGHRGQPLSDMTLLAVMKRMKAPAVPHGFRSTFRDWAAERTSYAGELAEAALAHTIGNKVEAAYRRGDLFAKRARMMEDWARFIDTPAGSGNVIHLHKEQAA